MPILDQLVQTNPHALHSLDPQAGLDIAEVKRLYGDMLCLIGNVSLVTLGRGTPEQVAAEAKGLIRDLGENGGYMLSSSNSIASYLPVENVLALSRAAHAAETMC